MVLNNVFFKKLKKFKNIHHCFFSRKDGYSKGIYKGLNCGRGSKDKRKNILKNLKLVEKKNESREKSFNFNVSNSQ